MELGNASNAELLAWFDSINTFLLDCDGVLWRATDPIVGVDKTISAIRAAGKRVFFVTNNSTKSRDEYVHKLKHTSNIDAVPEEILSSAYAAALYCKAHGINKKAYVLGQSGLVHELETVCGLEVLGPADFDKEFAFGSTNPKDLDPDVQAVICGFDGRVSYYKIAQAVSYLRYGPGCKFIATNRDATYPDSHQLVPGGGVIVGAVALGAGREPDVVAGKPSLGLLDIIADIGGLDRSATCMVGDRLDTDILFGNNGALAASLLVLTGVTRKEDLEKFPAGDPHRPTHILGSFGSLGSMLERAKQEL